jgi:hypothetical protein
MLLHNNKNVLLHSIISLITYEINFVEKIVNINHVIYIYIWLDQAHCKTKIKTDINFEKITLK